MTGASRVDRQAEKREEVQRSINRDRGFQDIEIDNLHGDIQRRVYILKSLMGMDEQATKDSGGYVPINKVFDITINTEMKRFLDEKYSPLANANPNGESDGFVRKLTDLTGPIAQSKRVFSIALGLGISVPENRQQYLYRTSVHLFTNEEGKLLTGVLLQFDRVNATGTVFLAERRLLINPSPDDKIKTPETDSYIADFEFAQMPGQAKADSGQSLSTVTTDTFDDNSDIQVEYFEASVASVVFPTKPIFIERLVWNDYKSNPMHSPMAYSKQLNLIEGYKRYLRRTRLALNQAIRDFDLKRRDRVGKMLEFLNSSN